jgi:outer membrane lipoprotein-sorting protein
MSRLRLAILLGIVLLVIVGGAIAVDIPHLVSTSGQGEALGSQPHTPTTASRTPAYHLTATRQRGNILIQLETWYIDASHQRTDIKVTLATGDKITIGTILNGTDLWSYRIEPEVAGLTRAVHRTRNIQASGRYLFTFGDITDIVAMYRKQGCRITQEQDPERIVNRKVTVITITPTQACNGQQFDIPNTALIYNNINYYQTSSGSGTVKKSMPGPMTVWIDQETSIVLQAQRTTANNQAWDQYRVTSIQYSPRLPEHLLNYTPPRGMIVLTNPNDDSQ